MSIRYINPLTILSLLNTLPFLTISIAVIYWAETPPEFFTHTAGTFMIEPTESESKAEIDRFANAIISIKGEIIAIHNGELDAKNNPLKNAQYTAAAITGNWDRPYSQKLAAFPTKNLGAHKFWPSVGRIDDVYGDRNLICSCPAIENYED